MVRHRAVRAIFFPASSSSSRTSTASGSHWRNITQKAPAESPSGCVQLLHIWPPAREPSGYRIFCPHAFDMYTCPAQETKKLGRWNRRKKEPAAMQGFPDGDGVIWHYSAWKVCRAPCRQKVQNQKQTHSVVYAMFLLKKNNPLHNAGARLRALRKP